MVAASTTTKMARIQAPVMGEHPNCERAYPAREKREGGGLQLESRNRKLI